MLTENGNHSDLAGHLQGRLGCQVLSVSSGSPSLSRYKIIQLSPDINGRRLLEYVADFYCDKDYFSRPLVKGMSLEVRKDDEHYIIVTVLTQNSGVLDIRNLKAAAA